MSLMEAYKIFGLNVTTDNLFMSLALARNLLEKSTKIVGNIRPFQRKIFSDVPQEKETALYTLLKFVFTSLPKNIMVLSKVK